MKKIVIVGVASAIVFICSCIAIVTSNDHQARVQAAQTSAVKKLQKQLKEAQSTTKLHDAVNTSNTKMYAGQIIILTNQKTALCTQIKAARLFQPLCQQ